MSQKSGLIGFNNKTTNVLLKLKTKQILIDHVYN